LSIRLLAVPISQDWHGFRIDKVISVYGNPMGGFFRRRDRDGQDRWWLAITGKGDKERLIPATTELMAELARYRRHYNLVALPYGGETTPLLLPASLPRHLSCSKIPTRLRTIGRHPWVTVSVFWIEVSDLSRYSPLQSAIHSATLDTR
jgi:hypothetical protein